MADVKVTKCKHGRCMCHLTDKPWRVKDHHGPGRPGIVSMWPSQAEALEAALMYAREEYA